MSESYNPPMNPMLLNPQDRTGQTVPALSTMTPALSSAQVSPDEVQYYTCVIPNHHMHRTDGKRLAFVQGILETDYVEDIKYMENELKAANPYVRRATKDEVHAHKMRRDPRATMTAEVRPDIEAEVTLRLQKALEEKFNTLKISLTDEQRKEMAEAGLLGSESKPQLDAWQPPEVTDQQKIDSMDAVSRLQGIKDSSAIKTPGATLVPSNTLQSSITGSDKTTNAADSNEANK